MADSRNLGRSSANELCYPDDAGLSRQHLALTRNGETWQVEDLGSKNGTVLNGKRIDKPELFKEGDRISAGHLTIEFADTGVSANNTVVFVEQNEAFSNTATTVVASKPQYSCFSYAAQHSTARRHACSRVDECPDYLEQAKSILGLTSFTTCENVATVFCFHQAATQDDADGQDICQPTLDECKTGRADVIKVKMAVDSECAQK